MIKGLDFGGEGKGTKSAEGYSGGGVLQLACGELCSQCAFLMMGK